LAKLKHLTHKVIPLVKSVTPQLILENCFDFEMSPGDLKVLDNLNQDLHVAWDPSHSP